MNIQDKTAMNCNDFREHIYSIAENDYYPYSIEEIEAHLTGCTGCSRLVKAFKLSSCIIDTDRKVEPDQYAATRLLQKLENYLFY